MLTAVLSGCTSAGDTMVPVELAASDATVVKDLTETVGGDTGVDTDADGGGQGSASSRSHPGAEVLDRPMSPAVDLTAGGAPIANEAPTATTAQPTSVDIADVTRIQQLLLAQGFDVGPIDGTVGPATSAAISAFQATIARPVTGQLDPATVRALVDAAVAVADQLPASVIVDLSDQRLLVHNATGELITYWPVSTGGPGSETPTGSFAVQSRQLVGTASSDGRVHMDFFTVFNEDIGFHGIPWVSDRDNRLWTPLGEYGVSHGCIRMEDSNADYLYSFLADGAPVEVRD